VSLLFLLPLLPFFCVSCVNGGKLYDYVWCSLVHWHGALDCLLIYQSMLSCFHSREINLSIFFSLAVIQWEGVIYLFIYLHNKAALCCHTTTLNRSLNWNRKELFTIAKSTALYSNICTYIYICWSRHCIYSCVCLYIFTFI
jgi:hypothetical protein